MSDKGEFAGKEEAELVDLMFAAREAGIGADQRARSARAQVELTRRDRAYAEKQAATRRDFEMALFNAEGERDVKRKQFEKALAERQMAHVTELAKDQLGAAQS